MYPLSPLLPFFPNPLTWFFGASMVSTAPAPSCAPTPQPLPLPQPLAIMERHPTHNLFVPTGPAVRPLRMVVMLHGAGQDPDDFAAGTRMNEAAQRHGFAVLYPRQSAQANAYRCWHWFDPKHQSKDHGEPAQLAALTRQVAGTLSIDPGNVFVAGMSAGGAMACLLGELLPELFSGVGVHSGLPSFCANDLSSALGAMRGKEREPTSRSGMPTIVFHGEKDGTVDPSNAFQVIHAAVGKGSSVESVDLTGTDGTRVTRRRYFDASSRICRGEHWSIKDGSHAWSGGSSLGSFATPKGPDASEAMLCFFNRHSAGATGHRRLLG